MPIYEYRCKKCGHRFEKLHQSFSEPRVKKCPECGGAVEQLFSAPAAHFKGEGFYVTDYARKGSKPSEGESSASPAKEKSETKSESKPDKKHKK
jgi:putative FmdB family regulatory protein